jgi:hypothetical protein
VEETVSSLSAGTTYHFRVVVTNAAGTVQGEDRTFTTAAAQEPPGPAGGTASPRPGPGPVTPGAPGTPGTPGVTAQPSGHGFDVSLRMSALPDLSAMLRHGLALRLGCTRRCHVTATLFLAHRRAALGRARGTMSPPAARRLVIRIGKAGRAALRRLSDAELTLRLVFTSGSSRRQLTRRLEATTPGAGLGGGLLGSHRTRRR